MTQAEISNILLGKAGDNEQQKNLNEKLAKIVAEIQEDLPPELMSDGPEDQSWNSMPDPLKEDEEIKLRGEPQVG